MARLKACFCGQPTAERDGEAATAQARAARPKPRRRKSKKPRSMLSRLLEGIVHLVEDDDDYTTASEGGEGGSPRVAEARTDSGHLTAATGTGSRRPSSRGGGDVPGSPGQVRVLQGQPSLTQQQQQQQQQQQAQRYGGGEEGSEEEEEEEEEQGQRRGGGWNILGGVPFLPRVLELLSPKATSDDEGEGGEGGGSEGGAPLQQPTSPGGSSLYPTLAEAEAAPRADDEDLQRSTTQPAPLVAGQAAALPQLSEPSGLMREEHIRALVGAVPARYHQARWTLLYATSRDGISLQTMLRNAARRSPTVLVVRDFDKHVFGAYCSEPWKLDKRFFGTGETFVFRLEPTPAVWYWWWRRMAREPNDYFQWGSPEAIAVGGAGGYALWLDADLTAGISRTSTTFGNDSLAGAEEFRIGAVELWGLS